MTALAIAACSASAGAGGVERGGGAAERGGGQAERGGGTGDVRAAIDRMTFPALRFRPPRTERRTLASGAPVLIVEDHTLPLVEVMVRFQGGPSHFPRARLGAVSALPALLRTGGTRSLAADSVDALIEYHAWRMGFGGGGTSAFASVGTLRRWIHDAVRLWAGMLMEPGFDAGRVEVWRGREIEAVRRRRDDPTFEAVTRFNELLYGDHPVGWVMEEADLDSVDLTETILRETHAAIVCPGNATFGVAGAIDADSAVALLDRAFAGWAPCAGGLPPVPDPSIRSEAGVYVLHRPLSQTTLYMGHGGGVTREDGSEYFASRIANAILGGSGLTSRVVRTLRTERGLAYGAGSVWTTPRDHEGALATFTQTRSDAAIASVEAIFEVLEELRRHPPERAEVERAVEGIANGFVFNFRSSAGIVARRMLYEAEGLPPDWLERYVVGIQQVRPADVQRVARARIHPSRMTLLVVGDTTRLIEPLAALGLGQPVAIPDGD